MADVVDDTSARLHQLLTERYGPVGLAEDDSFTIEHAGRRMDVLALPLGEDASAVQVLTPLVVNVMATDELFEELACTELVIGKPLVLPADDGCVTVVLVQRLLGDPIDHTRLELTMTALARAADRLDPALESRFGAQWTLEPGDGGDA